MSGIHVDDYGHPMKGAREQLNNNSTKRRQCEVVWVLTGGNRKYRREKIRVTFLAFL